MGNCFDCFAPPDSGPETPDPEERRKRQEAAALKRQQENESRGLRDPEGVKRKQQKKEQMNAAQDDRQRGNSGAGLQWTVG